VDVLRRPQERNDILVVRTYADVKPPSNVNRDLHRLEARPRRHGVVNVAAVTGNGEFIRTVEKSISAYVAASVAWVKTRRMPVYSGAPPARLSRR